MRRATDTAPPDNPGTTPYRGAGPLLLAAGGIAAAFGAASCCALPILLGSIGLGGAWLTGIAWLAAPHRTTLLAVAVACLLGGGALFLWRRRAAVCTADGRCYRSIEMVLFASLLGSGVVLAALGYLYA